MQMPASLRATRGAPPLVLFLLAVGVAARAAPLFDQGGRLLRQFPTEDGYLMLTIARNLALGMGMSTAEGTLPTNGTQPLATFLWSLCFVLVDGDKVRGVQAILLLQLVIAAATSYLIYRLGRRILKARPDAHEKSALGAAAWFASPVVVPHSMNCLETGLYGLVLTACFLLLLGGERTQPVNYRRWALLGSALGLAFWARNDAILPCAAVAFVHLVWGIPGEGTWSSARGRWRARLFELCTAGSVVVLLASPWLIFNYVRFGHVMPISGQAEGLEARFAENLLLIAPNLLEYLLLVTPIPSHLQGHWSVTLSSALVAALALSTLALYARRWHAVERDAFRLGLTLTLAFTAFYGLFFGAGYFVHRYLFALSPLCAVLWGSGVHHLYHTLRARRPQLVRASAAAALVVALAVHGRAYARGDQHGHFQVVAWVAAHVAEEAWVGAIQTGTLGFFHDRTINLDGKVNPEALQARRTHSIPRYIVTTEIEYLADWTGILEWRKYDAISTNFDVVAEQHDVNLAVLSRRAMAAQR